MPSQSQTRSGGEAVFTMEATTLDGGSMGVVLKAPFEGPSTLVIKKRAGVFTEDEIKGIEDVARTAFLGTADVATSNSR